MDTTDTILGITSVVVIGIGALCCLTLLIKDIGCCNYKKTDEALLNDNYSVLSEVTIEQRNFE